jgi:hypothetical protein
MKDLDSAKVFKEAVEGSPSSSEKRVDDAWCSDLCKKKVLEAILSKYHCSQKFAQTDVTPLYATGCQRYYRVILWVRDWANNPIFPVKEIWKTFYVTLEGIERRVVSIEEDRKPRLKMGEEGMKLRDELEGCRLKEE